MGFADVSYALFELVILRNISPKKLTKKFGLTEAQIRKIVQKDSKVTADDYAKWKGVKI